MKIIHVFIISTILYCSAVSAQQSKETSQDLSKAAKKGMISDIGFGEDGNLRATYDMKIDKKSDELASEDYVFDRNLSFAGIQPTKEKKEMKPDIQVTNLAAFVGGGNSFNVLSMKLTLQQEVWERKWNYRKQKYDWGKRLSKETVKPRNNDGKYKGFAAYANDEEGSVLVVASYDKDKDDDNQFVVLYITNDLNVKENVVPVKGSYSLVHCGSLQSGNIFLLLAPDKGMPDTKKYVMSEFTGKGELVYSKEFTAPSPNTLVMDYTEVNGDIVFAAGSDKSNDAYNQVFTSYAPIDNPGYSTGANRQMDKYEKRALGEKFDNFHLIRLSKGQLVFAGTTAAGDFKAKVVNPPAQKKSSPYEGKSVTIKDIIETPNGDYLVAAQMKEKKLTKEGYEYRYYDYICLQFDKNGVLKAQYAAEKVFDDKKNELFSSPQHFILGSDGNSVYWELLEVKAAKFYASIADAYFGNSSFGAHYFPRITKINLSSTTMTDFDGLGEKGKFLVYKNFTSLYDEKTKIKYYFGHDEDYEKLWIGKYEFK